MATRRRIIYLLKNYDRLYKRLAAAGTVYDAVAYFSINLASLPALDDDLRREWSVRLSGDQKILDLLDEQGLAEVGDGLGRDARRILHILSIGTRWNDDEIVLLLTLRVRIDNVLRFLGEHGITIQYLPLDQIDKRLEEVRRSTENQSDYASATSQMRKNGLPVGERWTAALPSR